MAATTGRRWPSTTATRLSVPAREAPAGEAHQRRLRARLGRDPDAAHGRQCPRLVLRYLEQDRGDQNQGFDMSKLGFPPSLVSQLPGGRSLACTHHRLSDARPVPDRIDHEFRVAPAQRQQDGRRAFVEGRHRHALDPVHRDQPGQSAEPHTNRAATQKDYARADGLSGNSRGILPARHVEQRQLRPQPAADLPVPLLCALGAGRLENQQAPDGEPGTAMGFQCPRQRAL